MRQVLGTEAVETCTIQEICLKNQFSGSNDLLVLEFSCLEWAALNATPEASNFAFEWIMVRVTKPPIFEHGATLQDVETTLKELGYHNIPSILNFSSQQVAALFCKRPNCET